MAQMNKSGDRVTATKKCSALRDAEREGPNRRFDPLCQLAPAINGWGLFPFLPGLDALTANYLHQQSLAISEFNPSRATIGSEKCS